MVNGAKMKKLAAATLNMILVLGVVCILAGVLLFPRLASHFNATVELWTIALTFAGAVTFYLSLVKFNSALVRFIGLYAVFSGFFFMVVGSGLVEQGIEGFWPVSIILAGISILLTGLTKDRRIRVSYLFPSIFLIGMGLYFLLFSLNLISMGFRKWISIFWPLFPLFLGICLVILFLIQQNPDSHFPYEDSEISENDSEGDSRE